MNRISTETIETERLILRQIRTEDAQKAYANWTSDEKVCRYVTWDIHPDVETTRAYFQYKQSRYQDPAVFDWIVILKETGEPIGEIEAVRVSEKERSCEMGDCYGSRFWNKGYATEALKAFISYMLGKVGLELVYARHISTNPASGRVMEKAGMHKDAVLPKYLVDKNTGKREDCIYYSIRADETDLNE